MKRHIFRHLRTQTGTAPKTVPEKIYSLEEYEQIEDPKEIETIFLTRKRVENFTIVRMNINVQSGRYSVEYWTEAGVKNSFHVRSVDELWLKYKQSLITWIKETQSAWIPKSNLL